MVPDISTKASITLFFFVSALTLPPAYRIALVLLILLLAFFSKSFQPYSAGARKFFVRSSVYLVGLSILIILVNGFLIREGSRLYKVPYVPLTSTGISFGVSIASRLVLLSTAVLLFFVSTPMRLFAAFLENLGLPGSLVSVILLSLFFIERLPKRISQILTAQEARGAAIRAGLTTRAKAMLTVLSPLVLSSVVESVERGIALELRGFNLEQRKGLQKPGRRIFSYPSYLILLLTGALLVISLVRWITR